MATLFAMSLAVGTPTELNAGQYLFSAAAPLSGESLHRPSVQGGAERL